MIFSQKRQNGSQNFENAFSAPLMFCKDKIQFKFVQRNNQNRFVIILTYTLWMDILEYIFQDFQLKAIHETLIVPLMMVSGPAQRLMFSFFTFFCFSLALRPSTQEHIRQKWFLGIEGGLIIKRMDFLPVMIYLCIKSYNCERPHVLQKGREGGKKGGKKSKCSVETHQRDYTRREAQFSSAQNS